VADPAVTRAASFLTLSGLALAALGLLDPRRPSLALLGAAASALGVLGAPDRRRRLAPLALIAGAYALTAWARPEVRADAESYLVPLRSAVFDRDLDFSNDWQDLGRPVPAPVPETGRPRTTHAVGAPVLWSPFYLAAHGYVRGLRALGDRTYEADGFSGPYRRAAALGTVAAAVLGAWLLGAMLAGRFSSALAGWAVAGAVASSPVVYYVLVVPAMAHGATFAASAALVWAWDRARRTPSRASWLAVGFLLGLLALTRWQAAVAALLVLPLALRQVRQRAVRWRWLAGAAAAGVLAFLPQLLVWKAVFGRWLVLRPHGAGYVGLSSPHLVDVLVSANHGLLAWTPGALLGLLGLLLGLRRDRLFHLPALAVCAATAWVNGSIADWDWEGGDAFGARRFDLVVPLLAVGLAQLLSDAAALVRRRPLLAPASAIVLLSAWNLGLIRLFRQGHYPEMAPFDDVAGRQARGLAESAQEAAGRLAGPRGRALAYSFFSGEYMFTSANPTGALELAEAGERELERGWASPPVRRREPPFRWAHFPEACVRWPLVSPIDRALEVWARAPRLARPQAMTLVVNLREQGTAELGADWAGHRFEVPAHAFQPGPNRLCLRFRNAAPGAREDARVAAAVARIGRPRVPSPAPPPAGEEDPPLE
jgi:hypothetical protein